MFNYLKFVFYELKNYLFLIAVIRKASKTKEWKSFNLRYDWVFRIYTVLLLRKEELGETDAITHTHVVDKARYVNEYLETLGLGESVVPFIRKLNETSYLLVYNPYFDKFNLTFVLKILFTVFGIWYIKYKNYFGIDVEHWLSVVWNIIS